MAVKPASTVPGLHLAFPRPFTGVGLHLRDRIYMGLDIDTRWSLVFVFYFLVVYFGLREDRCAK